jgi:hemerythrin-like domain-containing protein
MIRGLSDVRGDDLRELLADRHREIEAACAELRGGAYADEPALMVASFRAFERALVEHLDAEEALLLPAYARYDPEEAHAVRAQHQELRQMLLQLGVQVELHAVRTAEIERFIQALRAHAAYEDAGLYPWAQQSLPSEMNGVITRRAAGRTS